MFNEAPEKTPRWKWMVMAGVLALLIIPVIVAGITGAIDPNRRQEWQESSDSPSATTAYWSSLREDDTDALIHTEQGIFFSVYCAENGSIQAFVRSDVPFDDRRGFERRADDGSLQGYGESWGCSDLQHCSTETGNGALGSMPFVTAADGGRSVTMVFHMADGTTREISYDFSGVGDRYQGLVERCAG